MLSNIYAFFVHKLLIYCQLRHYFDTGTGFVFKNAPKIRKATEACPVVTTHVKLNIAARKTY
jgi:hypothetical protein